METKPTITFDNQYVLSRIEENKISKNLKIIQELKQIAPLLSDVDLLQLYKDALVSAENLEIALNKRDWDKVDIEMCNLGNACGTCHASFRRLLTSQLANEASAWSGKYINKCN